MQTARYRLTAWFYYTIVVSLDYSAKITPIHARRLKRQGRKRKRFRNFMPFREAAHQFRHVVSELVGGIHKGASTKSPCVPVPHRNIKFWERRGVPYLFSLRAVCIRQTFYKQRAVCTRRNVAPSFCEMIKYV